MIGEGSSLYESNPYSINNVSGTPSNTYTPPQNVIDPSDPYGIRGRITDKNPFTWDGQYSDVAHITGSGGVSAAPVQTSGSTNEQPWSPQFLDLSQYNLGIGQVPYFRASDINWGPYENNLSDAMRAWQNYQNYSMSDNYGGPHDWESILKTETVPGEGGDSGNGPYTRYIAPELKFRGNPSDYGDWGTSVFGHHANWDIIPDPNNPNAMGFMVKTGDKQGTVIPYTRQGDMWVPQTEGIANRYWDTNDSTGNLALASIVGLPFLFGGLASAGLIGGEAAAGAVDATAGAIDPWFTEPGFAPPVSTTPPVVPDPWSTEPGFSPPVSPGDPWATEPGFEPPIQGNPTTPGAGDLLRRIGQIGDIGRRILGGGGGGNQMGNVGGNANGLLGLLSALYGARQSREYADMLRQIAGQMQEQASPYINKLRESYENPNAYLESPEMKAVLNLEANRLAGIDASQGRLSNDINRTAKLQQLAQSRLGEYRRGLQQSIERMYQPMATASLFREAAGRQANAWQGIPQFFGAGGSAGNVWNDIKNIIGTGKDIWDVVSGWWD
jgi:hypothetical protein